MFSLSAFVKCNHLTKAFNENKKLYYVKALKVLIAGIIRAKYNKYFVMIATLQITRVKEPGLLQWKELHIDTRQSQR